MAATATAAPHEEIITYTRYGAAQLLFRQRGEEVVLAGPAGTGKTRANLEYTHLCALRYAGMRGLIVRKTLTSLTATTLVTFRERVQPVRDGVRFFSGNKQEPAAYKYPNGSTLVVGGMDNASKIMSSDYDLALVGEATDLTEDDWERIGTRLRNGVMPYQQLVADCNPGPPTHWLKQRADRGATVMLHSRHTDNPLLYDHARRDWTPFGARYIARLDALTGVRKERLRYGRWAAAEGLVYEGYEPRLHLVDRFDVPTDWPRYWVVDFGYTHPFVWQEWAEDDDGRLYRTREIYRTQRLVEDHAADILAVTTDGPAPQAIICDHDAEGRATLERRLGMATVAARKAVRDGIQAVSARLRPAGDGRPRLYLMRDSLVERDPLLSERRQPCCTEEEIDAYVWDTRANRRQGEEPLKEHDHGCDCVRYVTAFRDLVGEVTYAPSLFA